MTVMVKDSGVPIQPAADGVTVMVAVTGLLLLLIAVKPVIFPVPLAARPIDVLLFVQVKEVPLTAPVKLMALVIAPLHTIWLAGCTTSGVGLTVIVNTTGGAVHKAVEAVTEILAVTGALPVLMAVNAGIFPTPLAARPMDVLLFVQLKAVPAKEPEKFIAFVAAPLHIV